MTDLRTFEQITAADGDAVGGKGLSLGLMARAGLPVPPGFCVTTRRPPPRWRPRLPSRLSSAAADRRRLPAPRRRPRRRALVGHGGGRRGHQLRRPAGNHPRRRGRGRRFATAVGRCWASLDTERAVAYRQRQGVSDDGLAMAVVVQRLVPAEVAGVLFTRDPLDAEGRRMLVEASWGLGESVVSGRVTPDRFHLDRDTGQVLDQHIGAKTVPSHGRGRAVGAGRAAERALPGRRAAGRPGRAGPAASRRSTAGPRDVEWAWAEGRFWLLAGPADHHGGRRRARAGAPGGDRRPARRGPSRAAPSGAASTCPRSCPSRRR